MIKLYANLVETNLRALYPNDEGILLVPSHLVEDVKEELERRNSL